MMVKPIRALEFEYPMIQFLIMYVMFESKGDTYINMQKCYTIVVCGLPGSCKTITMVKQL